MDVGTFWCYYRVTKAFYVVPNDQSHPIRNGFNLRKTLPFVDSIYTKKTEIQILGAYSSRTKKNII